MKRISLWSQLSRRCHHTRCIILIIVTCRLIEAQAGQPPVPTITPHRAIHYLCVRRCWVFKVGVDSFLRVEVVGLSNGISSHHATTNKGSILDLEEADGLLAGGACKANKVRDGVLWWFRGHGCGTEGFSLFNRAIQQINVTRGRDLSSREANEDRGERMIVCCHKCGSG